AVTTFTNSGTVTKTGSDQVTINSSFSNSGTTAVNAGILTLAGGDAGGTTGGYPVASGATLDFGGGSFNLTSGVGVTGAGSGRFDGNNPTVTFAAPYSLTNLTQSSGTVSFNTGSGLSPTSMALSGGTLNVNVNASVSSLTHSGGTLAGSGTLTLTSAATSGGGIALTWTAGGQSGSGSTVLATGTTATVDATSSGAVSLDLGRSFVNNGTLSWNGGTLNSGCCDSTRGYAISNTGNWTVGASSNFSYNIGCCTGSVTTITNSGTFTKVGSGQLTINSSFKNSGTTAVNAGTLTLAGGDAGGATGSYPVASGATLDFNGGNFNFTSGAGVTGAGSGRFDGNNPNVTFAAPYTLPNLTQSSGTVSFNAG